MKTKEYIIKDYKKHKRHKKAFLLAWAKYFTYEELSSVDMLEVYDAAVGANKVKSAADWNKSVIEYTEDNIKKSMCIAFYEAVNAIIENNTSMISIYADDIVGWLSILEDTDIKYKATLNVDNIKQFYKKVADKYHFDFNI